MSVVKVLLREVTLFGPDDTQYRACIRPDDVSIFGEYAYGTRIIFKNGLDYTTPIAFDDFKELMNEV